MKKFYDNGHNKVNDIVDSFDIISDSSKLKNILSKTVLYLQKTLGDELFVDDGMKKKLEKIKNNLTKNSKYKEITEKIKELKKEVIDLNNTIGDNKNDPRILQVNGKNKQLQDLEELISSMDIHLDDRFNEYQEMSDIANNLNTSKDFVEFSGKDNCEVEVAKSSIEDYDIKSQFTTETGTDFVMGDTDGKSLDWDDDKKGFIANLPVKPSGNKRVLIKGMSLKDGKLAFENVQIVEPDSGELVLGVHFKQPLELSITSKTKTTIAIKVCNIKKLKINLDYPVNKNLDKYYDDDYFNDALENFYKIKYSDTVAKVVKNYVKNNYPSDFARLEKIIEKDPMSFLKDSSGNLLKVDMDDTLKNNYKNQQIKSPTKPFVNESEYKNFLQKDLEKKMGNFLEDQIVVKMEEKASVDVIKQNLKSAISTKTDLETKSGRTDIIKTLDNDLSSQFKVMLDNYHKENYLDIQKTAIMEELQKEPIFDKLPQIEKDAVYSKLLPFLYDTSLACDEFYYFDDTTFFDSYVSSLAKDDFDGTIEEYRKNIQNKFYQGYENFFKKMFVDRLDSQKVEISAGNSKKARVFVFETILGVDNGISRIKDKSFREAVFDKMNIDYDPTRGLRAGEPREEFDGTLFQKYDFNYLKLQRDSVMKTLKNLNSKYFDSLDDNGKEYLYQKITKDGKLTSPNFKGVDNRLIELGDLNYDLFKDFVVSKLPTGVRNEAEYEEYLSNNIMDLAEDYLESELDTKLQDSVLNTDIRKEFFDYRKSMESRKIDTNDDSVELAKYIDNNRKRLDPVYSVWPLQKMTNYTSFFSGHTASLKDQSFDVTDKGVEKKMKYSMDLNFTSVNNVRADIEIDGEKLALKDKTPFRLASGILKDNRIPYGKLRMHLAYNIMKMQIKKAMELGLGLQFKTTSGKLGSFEMKGENLNYVETDPKTGDKNVIFDEQDFKNTNDIRRLRTAMEGSSGGPGLLMLFNKGMKSLNKGYRTATSRLTLPKKPLRYNTAGMLGTRWFRELLNKNVNKDFSFDVSSSAGDKTATISFSNGTFEANVSGLDKPIVAKNLGRILRQDKGGESLFAGMELEIIQKVNQELLKQLLTNTRIKKRAYGVLDENTGRVYIVDQDGDISYVSPQSMSEDKDPRRKHWLQKNLETAGVSAFRQQAGIIKYRDLPGNRVPLDEQGKKEFFTNPILCARVLKRMAGRLGPVGWL